MVDPQQLRSESELTPAELRELYTVDDADLEHVRRIGERASDRLDSVIADFYTWLRGEPWFDEFFSDPATLERVTREQRLYWEAFMAGRVDDDYVARRHTVGQVHARIGLPMYAYLAAMNLLQELLFGVVEQEMPKDQHADLLSSMSKLMHLDTAIVVDAYTQKVQESLTEQADAILAMSTPVTEIWDGILFLPVVGLIDSHRARDIMDSTLAKIAATQAQIFVLDISGVGVVDTAVANNLFRITRATKLMGCESIISGVSPAIAQTIVDLGIDVGRIRTTATMRDALALAFKRVGFEIGVAR
jgi:rsbT co-antagonist protein RsbR